MPSIVTSLIGGLQGSSAAHNAANQSAGGYNSAGATMGAAVNQANSVIRSRACCPEGQRLAGVRGARDVERKTG